MVKILINKRQTVQQNKTPGAFFLYFQTCLNHIGTTHKHHSKTFICVKTKTKDQNGIITRRITLKTVIGDNQIQLNQIGIP